MMNKSFWLIPFLVFGLMCPSVAQEDQQASASPSATRKMPGIPGAFVFEFGFNQPFNTPDSFDIGFWGARTVNVYYQAEKRLGQSKFSIHPGFGFSLERYKLSNNYTLLSGDQGSYLVPATELYPNVKKSMIVTNYFEVPVELRYSTNPDDPTRTFRVSIGGRIGYLFDSFTKVKYSENGETKKIKDKQLYHLNRLRYGASLKFGVGNLNLFGYYNISPLFKTDEGPQDTEMNNFTVGISLSGF